MEKRSSYTLKTVDARAFTLIVLKIFGRLHPDVLALFC
jgi:hypothetical protein